MEYIHFTEEQKQRANATDLVEFLKSQREEVIRSGKEWRWKRHDSVTIEGNRWYRHSRKEGGFAVEFVQEFYNMSYPEAVTFLLAGENGAGYPAVTKEGNIKKKKELVIPPACGDMRRSFAYLIKNRCIRKEIVSYFAKTGQIYEEAEHHNIVFVGFDETGKPRHAHIKGISSKGQKFYLNAEGSEPEYAFGYVGTSDTLYVFEAAIDLLSFLTLYSVQWKQHSYQSLDGVSEYAMVHLLRVNPHLKKIVLCLDHDPAGIEACYRLKEILNGMGYEMVTRLSSNHKDWNEDLKAMAGMEVIPATEHPKLQMCQRICLWLKQQADGSISIDEEVKKIECAFRHYQRMDEKLPGRTMEKRRDAIECFSDMVLASYRLYREYYDNKGRKSEDCAVSLFQSYKPHRDKNSLRARLEDVDLSITAVKKVLEAEKMEMKPKENNAGQSQEGPNEAAESGTEGQLIRESEQTNKVEATDQAVYCLRQLCMECIKAGMFFCFDYLEMVHDMGMQMKQ
ncbi:MAG: DUF3991 and toprim domain-containing protein [Hungatella hathewayi]|uniref:DUF3991 and toprim domain-containing protein n=1 Tax=Hungatella TaxID=1649459 RepID=UPI001105BE8B|nr:MULTISPECIES: DUF3991 and toprim domain-containing protein [Hungatella]MCI7380807.1 DUF3991 and toprim domain-containing protein [Hungatella sp.]MDY6235801.1 DUF3991 and toprim domain-containing protein [Hungatella hathewayi]